MKNKSMKLITNKRNSKKELQEISRRMKISFLFLLMVACCWANTSNSYAQKTELSLTKGNKTLQELFTEIEQKSEFIFLYNDNVMDLSKKVSVDGRKHTLPDILNKALEGTEVGYEIVDRQVIIYKAKEESQAAATSGAPQQTDKKQIIGTVTDSQGEAIIGANVIEKGVTNNGAITDINGKFTLTVSPNATLVISYIGYKGQEIAVGNQTNLQITLLESSQGLDEVVVVAYGVQKKASLTGSVASIKGEQLQNVPTSNLTNALAGKLGGVTIAQNSGGRPGNSSELTIRARGTWNSTAPLYVIDGVVRDAEAFNVLDANVVESISVLKDASAASIYGSRAANGVILVQTKKGQSGQAVVSYSGSVGVSNFALLPERESTMQHIMFTNDYYREYDGTMPIDPRTPYSEKWGTRYYPNTYKNGVNADDGYFSTNIFTDDEIEYYKNPANQHNLLDEAWKTPISTNHAVNISGGTDKVTYFAGATYYNETGAFKSLDYTKYSIRGNMEAKLAKGLTAGLAINTSNSTDNGPYGQGRDLKGLFNRFVRASTLIPATVDGKYIGMGSSMTNDNPIAIADGANGFYKNRIWNTEYTASLQYEIPGIKGLSVKALYNKYIRQDYGKEYSKPYDVYQLLKVGAHQHIVVDERMSSVTKGGKASLSESHSTNDYYQLNGFINYNHTFGKHDIGAMLGFEQSESAGEGFGAVKSNYDLNNLPYFNFGPTDKQYYNVTGEAWEDARLSYIGRFNYGYDNRYLLEFSFRRDASVKFDANHRWGFFPSGSAAWRISEESFFKEKVSAINNLKLRGSVGLTGNDAVGSWQYMDMVNVPATGAYYGGTARSYGAAIGSIANPYITWEKSLNYNGGLDAGILNNMFTLGFDYFFRHTYDILGPQTNEIPDTFGATLADSNYGIVDSWGYELELGFNKQINKDIALYARGNFGFSDNKIVEWAETGVPAHLSKIGKNWDRRAGYIANELVTKVVDNGNGTYTINDKYTASKGYYEKTSAAYDAILLRPGNVFYTDLGSSAGVDANGNKIYSTTPDGKISNDDADKTWIIDRYNPPYNFGLLLGGSWKGFSLEVFFQGLAGHKTVISSPDAASYGWSDSNWTFWSEDHFSMESYPNGKMPSPTNMAGLNMASSIINSSTENISFWVRDASFVRLKNVTLSYDINKKLLSKAGISLAKVYVTGNNLALLYNPLKYFDPELAGSYNNPDPNAATPGTGMDSYPLMRTFTFGVNFSF
jgi:TonB-linked SusC/RagA family outer membrane protein